MERVDRRTFIRRGILTVAALAALPSVLACAPQEEPREIITPDKLSAEQLQLLQDRTWQSLTNVLNEGFFSQDSLKIDHLAVTKGHNPKIAGQEVHIMGSLNGQVIEGHTGQLGVGFRVTYAKDTVYGQKPLKLDVEGNSLTVGEELGKGLRLSYFFGENAGEVLRHPLYLDVVRDPQGMQKRFEDMKAELPRILKIPDTQPFIPEEDFNGLVTFVDHNRTGFGLYMESAVREGIEGKVVNIEMTEGQVADNSAWTSIARRYHNYVKPDQISFRSILRVALDDLELKNNSSLTRSFHQVDKDQTFAAEYIRQLGVQYLPNQPQVSGK